MMRGKFRAVRLRGGGGRAESSQLGTDSASSGIETGAGSRGTRGVRWPAALAARKWFVSGTVFLQQSSAFALGAHCPFIQHFIASGVRALAKQSKGRASRTIAKRLTTI